DYLLPTTACLLQDRLQLPRTCAAFDMNLGCSGFTYGLWLARSLVLSQSARNVLLLTGDTYSKYCDPTDLATASLFGDGATAGLVSAEADGAWAEIGTSVLGTDGRGAGNLIVKSGGSRQRTPGQPRDGFLFMNGAEIATFAVGTVKPTIHDLLTRTGLQWADIDRFVFHQANPAFVKRLAEAYRIPPEKVLIDLADVGNTCSATIPMVLERGVQQGLLAAGQRVILVGFGVGYSWAATLLMWLRAA
ncbi:MAG TPA: ketoacyl-ACP synthase III, partial [Planctomycetaceae bacterium]|nr:ketoacyl-ACP synthase III [Planctomycetaceae bacterium]